MVEDTDVIEAVLIRQAAGLGLYFHTVNRLVEVDDMTSNNIVALLAAVLPTIILVFGGQHLLNRYEVARKSKEQEIELIRAVREKQYEAVEALYASFATFMALYRTVNSPYTDLKDISVRQSFFEQAVEAEAKIDELILRIGCEFPDDKFDQLEYLLGHLRQSVQLWRECIRNGKVLPFTSSNSPEYMRFKETFASTAAYLVHHIHNKLESVDMRMDETRALLTGVFSNKYEHEAYQPGFVRERSSS